MKLTEKELLSALPPGCQWKLQRMRVSNHELIKLPLEPSIGLCGTTRCFPIIGRFQTGLDIFQPSNQDHTEARTEAEMRYIISRFFLIFTIMSISRQHLCQNKYVYKIQATVLIFFKKKKKVLH